MDKEMRDMEYRVNTGQGPTVEQWENTIKRIKKMEQRAAQRENANVKNRRKHV